MLPKISRSVVSSLLVLFAALTLVACSDSSEPASAGTAPEAAAPQVAEPEAATAAPEAEVVATSSVRLDDVEVTPELTKLGERVFIRCRSCHTLNEGGAHTVGPNLHDLFGAKAGVKEGFMFSDALKNSGIVWDEETLRSWIRSPSDLVPGHRMGFVGLPDENQQTAVLIYLREHTK